MGTSLLGLYPACWGCFYLLVHLTVGAPDNLTTVLWPAGSYGLPQPVSGCPQSKDFTWKTGNLFQALNPYSQASKPFHLNATVNREGVTKSFCIKSSTNSDRNRPKWPKGRYCIYMKTNECPTGMRFGSIYWNDRMAITKPSYTTGALPRGIYTTNTLINFCCSTKGDYWVPITLPLGSPFVLFPYGSPQCQKVNGALSQLEYIEYDTENSNNKWVDPYPYLTGSYSDPRVYYCYYSACSTTLTATSGRIQSPNYPENYPHGADCSWKIELPTGYQITLEFPVFKLESSLLLCNIACSCDWLRVTLFRSGNTYKTTFCMDVIHFPSRIIQTRTNVVLLEFHSNSAVNAKGFDIKYTSIAPEVNSTTPSILPSTTPINNTEQTTYRPAENTSTPGSDVPGPGPTTSKYAGVTSAMNGTNFYNSTGQASLPRSGEKGWVLAVAITLSILALLAVIGSLAYWRFGKSAKKMREWLVIRYSSDASNLGVSTRRTIDMYSGDDVEIIPEGQLSDNPIYGDVMKTKEEDIIVPANNNASFAPDDSGTTKPDSLPPEESTNPLYATPEDLKTDNPLYQDFKQCTSQEPVSKSEGALYERIM